MGTDNLHHKRQKRSGQSIKRKKIKYQAYDRVLIVCEGKKTERYYFEDLCDNLKLNSANIKIVNCHPAPINIVKEALKLYKEDTGYDHIYCVFDKDIHTTYEPALEIIKKTRLPKGGKLHAINSIPCFEYWLLLHFAYTTKQFSATNQYSMCEQLIKIELERYLPNYEKGKEGLFKQVEKETNLAIQRAKQIETHNKTIQTDDPSTKVYKLVEYLKNLKSAVNKSQK